MLIYSKLPLYYIFVLRFSFIMLNIAVHITFLLFRPKVLALDSEKYEDSVQRKR